jgi:hypothetical protein
VVAASHTDHAAESLAPRLATVAESQDWAALTAAIKRLLHGKRDQTSLLTGLDPIDAAILSRILQRL